MFCPHGMVNGKLRNLEGPQWITRKSYDWLLADFETFTRHKSLGESKLQSADLLEKGEYGPGLTKKKKKI
ncbi:MAG: hypothetical protein CM15mP106_4660 [Candidatus Neomarinimicrobiota bacterium]|nr:MAG: hypothetical protein CM15mP106_4660 [Candidatus Neomarinimicrobiota bacterium]